MTLPENSVPLVQRILCVEGHASSKALAVVGTGLPRDRRPTTRCLFAGFAYADLPLGKSFECVFEEGASKQAEAGRSVVVAVS